MLADRFCIGPKKAQATLKATLQQGTRSAILPLSRRYKADRNFRTKQLRRKFSTDTLYADAKSLNGNIAAQLYPHKCGFTVIYPMPKADGEHIGQSLNDFIHEWGVPEYLTFDGHMTQKGQGTDFMKTIKKHHMNWHISQPYWPTENPAEGAIWEVKRSYYRLNANMGYMAGYGTFL